jgi:hypothetical protein
MLTIVCSNQTYNNKKRAFSLEKALFFLSYFLDSSTETFLKSFISLLSSRADLRARVPAALLPPSICAVASF